MKRKIPQRTLIITAVLLGASLITGAALACGAAGPSTHIGQLLSIDSDTQTFTIRDAETRGPITFGANDEIITTLQGFAGNLMVNYEEGDKGLTAIGVTF